MAHVDYILYDTVLGYGLFKVLHQVDTVALRTLESEQAFADLSRFGKMVNLVNFSPFRGHTEALENTSQLSEGTLPDYLKSVLEHDLPKTSGKKAKIVLGVMDKGLANAIKSFFTGVDCETVDTSEAVDNLFRGTREFADKMMKDFVREGEVADGCRGFSHAASRSKVKFNITRHDQHVIQASATIDFQDKSVNQFYMRVREWYGYHFPELINIVSDNLTYAKLVLLIGDKSTLTPDKLHELAAVVGDDEEKAQAIIDAAQMSMGPSIAPVDLEIVLSFASAVVQQAAARRHTANYLDEKMTAVAPNLKTLIGTPVAARLISQAGSLTNLAKYPASTLQIIGAEKALFRALKTKSNTPKYGIIYHSSFIGKAQVRNKGRISRYLANKCSIASRIDNFSKDPSSKFGEALKQQVEDRLEFYASGKKPAKNADVMQAAIESVMRAEEGDDTMMLDVAQTAVAPDAEDSDAEVVTKKKKSKKDKKAKKEKKEKRTRDDDALAVDGDRKKKKKVMLDE